MTQNLPEPPSTFRWSRRAPEYRLTVTPRPCAPQKVLGAVCMQLPGNGGTKGSKGKNSAYGSCFQIPWTEKKICSCGVSYYFPHIHAWLIFWRPTFYLVAPSLLVGKPAVNQGEVWTVGLNIVPLWCLVVENSLILRIKKWVGVGRQSRDGILERLDSKTLVSGVWSTQVSGVFLHPKLSTIEMSFWALPVLLGAAHCSSDARYPVDKGTQLKSWHCVFSLPVWGTNGLVKVNKWP